MHAYGAYATGPLTIPLLQDMSPRGEEPPEANWHLPVRAGTNSPLPNAAPLPNPVERLEERVDAGGGGERELRERERPEAEDERLLRAKYVEEERLSRARHVEYAEEEKADKESRLGGGRASSKYAEEERLVRASYVEEEVKAGGVGGAREVKAGGAGAASSGDLSADVVGVARRGR